MKLMFLSGAQGKRRCRKFMINTGGLADFTQTSYTLGLLLYFQSDPMRLRYNAIKSILPLVFILMYCQQAWSDPVQFTRQELKFHPQAEDTCSAKKVEVVNISSQPISNPGFRIEGSSSFSVQRYFRKCPNPLGPGETCSIYVNFCPYLNRSYQALLYFEGTRVFLRMTGEGRIRKW